MQCPHADESSSLLSLKERLQCTSSGIPFRLMAGEFHSAACMSQRPAMQGHKAFVNAARQSQASYEPDCGQGCPVVGDKAGQAKEADCPVITQSFDLRDLRSEAASSAATSSRQSSDLQDRTAAGNDGPMEDVSWMYPSERVFFNAMQRRGWRPHLRDMQAVVAIHNAGTERVWSEILKWERLHCHQCKESKLQKYVGKGTAASPKARFLSLLGHQAPFDMQEWVVSRCGREVRYLVDFHNAAPLPSMPVALRLDVRPALDSFEALLDRLKMFAGTAAKKPLRAGPHA